MKRYNSPWNYFAIDWSMNSGAFCSLAISSFIPTKQNQLQVLVWDRSDQSAAPRTLLPETVAFDYVATKLMWSPTKLHNKEYLALSGNGLQVYSLQAEEGLENCSLEKIAHFQGKAPRRNSVSNDSMPISPPNSTSPMGSSSYTQAVQSPAPLTSFDWNRIDPTLLVTAAYDTTCTVWSLETGTVRTQLIAHDKEVFDVAYSPTSLDTFVSVGADGSLRLFDVRTLEHSTIVYETPDARALLRVQWNPLDPNYMATFAVDSDRVIVLDVRMPSVPAAELVVPRPPILALRWAPHSSSMLMTSDEHLLRLWDLSAQPNNALTPISVFDPWTISPQKGNYSMDTEPASIQNIIWPAVAPDWVALSSTDQITLMKI